MAVLKIDSHQHFWKLSRGDYDWLTPELDGLYRDYLPADLAPLLEAAGVSGTVVVQAAPTILETDFLINLAQRNEFILGVVGWLDMLAPEFAARLAFYRGNTSFKGIRPMIQDIPDPDWILLPELAPAFEALEAYDLPMDALVHPLHLDNLLTVMKRYPDLRVVIDHGAKPDIRGQNFKPWADEMVKVARQTSACVKLSGLVTEATDAWQVEDLVPWANHLLEHFGPERMMWGSDWPVLNLASDYGQWMDVTEQLLSGLSDSEQQQVMAVTACSFYGLEVPR